MNLATHELYLYSPTGQPLDIITDGGYAGLDYGLRENEPGVLILDLPGNYPLENLMIDGQFEIWRRYGGYPKHLEGDTGWFIRRAKPAMDQNGIEVIRVVAFSAAELLKRRSIPYVAGSSYTTKVGIPWDNMMREVVYENFGPGASYAGASYGDDPARNLEPWLTIEANQGYGASFPTDHTFSWAIVMNALQGIVDEVRSNGVYCAMDVVRISPAHYEFRVFLGARGMDHSQGTSNPVVLSRERKNLLAPSWDDNWEDEFNFVYAAGQGQEDDRIVRTAQDDSRINISPFNRREFVKQCSNVWIPESVQSEADAGLQAGRPKRLFTGTISQTPGCIYGVHWGWGDIVTAEYKGRSFDCHVEAVTVTIDNIGNEIVTGTLRSEADV
jgi:hypothetical protein